MTMSVALALPLSPLLKLCVLLSISAHLTFASASASVTSMRAGIKKEAIISSDNANNSPLAMPPTPTSVNRAGEERCSTKDVDLEQGQLGTLPNGIPTFGVRIMNVCVSLCTISNIHVSCGWFSSATLVNPNIFKRISYDDCLVNAGNPLQAGEAVAFRYANTRSYPLSVSSVACSV